ncbi:isocitrate lyase/PEP mutase family protein [Candidimonas nitroreducens]|uniref:Carboxyvinyl-carboxyphosphonate phosphorylmutase n=1 Tax=Candidimonas nitroreducens TaxID=683354 RepID=A0A225MQJ3_9BURK|nr:isocitrate lyase/PEP mutase family protein [Candidimonas nitroreducens]OWT61711.1 carboxyvinyl-carboxyphosphonate phosphorylmutase [Candidimonas nitroreducens]
MTRTSTRLRALFETGKTVVKPGTYDALSAVVAERAGFKCCGLSGYAVSAALLGRPDVGLVTMTEMVDVARRITHAVSIPLIADVDTGYGNAINAIRTAEEFITAGVAGFHIEDQVAPKRCGHFAGKQIIPVEEMVGKLRAVDHVRKELDPDFLLIARCDARGVAGGSVDALIERSNRYLDAGADHIFPEGLTSEEELVRCVREINGPIHYNRAGISPRIPLARLNEIGVALVSNATGALRASAAALVDYLDDFMRDDVEAVVRYEKSRTDRQHPTAAMHAFLGLERIHELEKEFLPADAAAKYEGSLGYR